MCTRHTGVLMVSAQVYPLSSSSSALLGLPLEIGKAVQLETVCREAVSETITQVPIVVRMRRDTSVNPSNQFLMPCTCLISELCAVMRASICWCFQRFESAPAMQTVNATQAFSCHSTRIVPQEVVSNANSLSHFSFFTSGRT